MNASRLVEGPFCRFGLAVVALMLVAGVASNAEAQETLLQVQAVSGTDWPSVDVTLTAFDQDGQPYAGLLAEDFSASINGEAVTVSALQTTSDPGIGIGVVLAFDVSGSMAGAPLEEARVAGLALVGQLGPDDQAAVVTFGSEVSVALPFTADRAALEAAINGLAIAGDTALYGGVEASALLARDSGLERRAIILLSDGFDFGGLSAVSREQSLALARDSGAMMFAVGLGAEIDEAYLQELAAAGRGQYLLAPSPADLTSAYLAAEDILRQQYVLTLDASAVVPESEDATVTIGAIIAGEAYVASADFKVPAGALAPPPEPEPTASVQPVEPPVPEPVDEPAAESAEDSSSPVVAVAGATALALLLGGVGVFILRRRKSSHAEPAHATTAASERLGRLDTPEPVAAVREVTAALPQSGPAAWIERPGGDPVRLSGAPVTVGVTSDCDVRLPGDGTGISQARVRIWRRDGSYMVHNLSQPPHGVTIGGRPVSWAILEDGDEIVIGTDTIAFHLSEERDEE